MSLCGWLDAQIPSTTPWPESSITRALHPENNSAENNCTQNALDLMESGARTQKFSSITEIEDEFVLLTFSRLLGTSLQVQVMFLGTRTSNNGSDPLPLP